ncbi:hypothetical protein COCOBI_12-5410 [Coccomyxa sp. Obi]|nr:hypothetical protein COCOBI_12-5410 [Coccomyxa sp. Obi]
MRRSTYAEMFNHAGTNWLSKRWAGATVLRVSDAGEKTAKELVAWAISGQNHFVRLKQLLIRPELLEDAREDAKAFPSDTGSQAKNGDTARRTWTDELLARAEQLTVLAACMDTAPLVNCLRHLKNLVLCCGDFHAAFAALPEAHSLETLCLGTFRRQQLEIDWSCSFPTVDYHHEPLAVPCLMLEALPNLRSVALRDLRPQQLQLPVGCELHLSGWELWDLNAELAPDLLACWPLNSVRSLSVMGSWPSVMSTGTFAAAFSRFHSLRRVDLRLACPIGRADAPALVHLDHVQELSISCDALHMRVPTEVAWEALVLSAPHGAVMLAFDNVQRFAAKVPEMSVHFGALGGLWGFTQLEAALQTCGASFEYKPVDGDVPGTFLVSADGCSVFERRFTQCGCKACLPCLTAAGVVAV